jgi:hypothetical protein
MNTTTRLTAHGGSSACPTKSVFALPVEHERLAAQMSIVLLRHANAIPEREVLMGRRAVIVGYSQPCSSSHTAWAMQA